mmetsp:Transcript_16988/g.36810  ORF Transcript_16988/g.36810 Transcript_16988/m.36810 type:complete len:443 (+) Transcript_16988:102-1430(+)
MALTTTALDEKQATDARAMITRGIEWLISRARPDKKAFKLRWGSQKDEDARVFGEWEIVQTAYTLSRLGQALAELRAAGDSAAMFPQSLVPMLRHLETSISASSSTYVVAAVGNALALAGPWAEPAANKLAEMLFRRQQSNGSLSFPRATLSVLRASGATADREAGAMTLHLWTRVAPRWPADGLRRPMEKLVAWLMSGGRWSSTHDTQLGFGAMLAYFAIAPPTPGDRVVAVSVDGTEVERVVVEAGARKSRVDLPPGSLTSALEKGTGTKTLEFKVVQGGEAGFLPFQLNLAYTSTDPHLVTRDELPLRLTVDLPSSSTPEGHTTSLSVAVHNAEGKELPMTVIVVGFPGGLEPSIPHLDELVATSPLVRYYELDGRKVTLILESIPKVGAQFLLDAVAAVPGEFSGPASVAYPYYMPSLKAWARPLKISITSDAEFELL